MSPIIMNHDFSQRDNNRLLAYCKGGNFNILIWASSAKEGKSGLIYKLVEF